MSAIYIHIPFCKQACHYCDFHFSTSLGKKEAMISALQKELVLRKSEFEDEVVETIYFGGGTPSVLEVDEIKRLIDTVNVHYTVSENPEITLEANPDDLMSVRTQSRTIFEDYINSKINRLSIGIQSFFDEDLQLMNRAHSSEEAIESLSAATNFFKNISIDLIYGIPGMGNDRWERNIEKALTFSIPHISSYALTVEPKTALAHMIKTGKVANVDDALAHEQFHILDDRLKKEGFSNYEISNFGKKGYFSKNNTAYWQGKKYMGIGPSAHSFDGHRRAWNVRNNAKYINSIASGELPMETEVLSITDQYIEYVMTGLRTIWGVSLDKINSEYGETYVDYIKQHSRKKIEAGLLTFSEGVLLVTKKGKFLADGIAADLFMLNLD